MHSHLNIMNTFIIYEPKSSRRVTELKAAAARAHAARLGHFNRRAKAELAQDFSRRLVKYSQHSPPDQKQAYAPNYAGLASRQSSALLEVRLGRHGNGHFGSERSNDDMYGDQREFLERLRSSLPALSRTRIGGLRGDPFEMFPIEKHVHVQEAFDICESPIFRWANQ